MLLYTVVSGDCFNMPSQLWTKTKMMENSFATETGFLSIFGGRYPSSWVQSFSLFDHRIHTCGFRKTKKAGGNFKLRRVGSW